jgi:hypothetical protein
MLISIDAEKVFYKIYLFMIKAYQKIEIEGMCLKIKGLYKTRL